MWLMNLLRGISTIRLLRAHCSSTESRERVQKKNKSKSEFTLAVLRMGMRIHIHIRFEKIYHNFTVIDAAGKLNACALRLMHDYANANIETVRRSDRKKWRLKEWRKWEENESKCICRVWSMSHHLLPTSAAMLFIDLGVILGDTLVFAHSTTGFIRLGDRINFHSTLNYTVGYYARHVHRRTLKAHQNNANIVANTIPFTRTRCIIIINRDAFSKCYAHGHDRSRWNSLRRWDAQQLVRDTPNAFGILWKLRRNDWRIGRVRMQPTTTSLHTHTHQQVIVMSRDSPSAK